MTIEAGSFVLPSAVPIILFALLLFVLLAIVCAREKAEKSLGANGADGISNIEGKVARVATSKLGNERVSNSTSALSTMPCSSSARYRCPLSRRGSTVSSPKAVKVPYPDME